MWPYCGHFQRHRQFWMLDRIGDRLIQLAIVNHEDYHFKFQNRSSIAKLIRGGSEDALSHLNNHKGPPSCEPRMVSLSPYFEFTIQPHYDTCLFGVRSYFQPSAKTVSAISTNERF